MSTPSVKKIIEALGTEYDSLLEIRKKTEAEYIKIREFLDQQLTSMQSLSYDFEEKIKEYRAKEKELKKREIKGKVLSSNDEDEDSSDKSIDWKVYQLQKTVPVKLETAPTAEFVDNVPIRHAKFSYSNNYIAFSTENTLRIFDRKNNKFILRYIARKEEYSNEYTSLCWAPDDSAIFVGSMDHFIRIFALDNFENPIEIHVGEYPVTQIAISPNSVFFAATTTDGSISVYDFSSKTNICSIKRKDGIQASCLSINHNSTAIAIGYIDGIVAFFDVAQATIHAEYKCHDVAIRSLCFVGEDQLATGSLDTTIRIWNISEDERALVPWRELRCHTDYVFEVITSPDERWLASASRDGTVKLTWLETGESYYSLEGHSNSVLSVDFTRSGDELCTAGGDNCAKLWSFKTSIL